MYVGREKTRYARILQSLLKNVQKKLHFLPYSCQELHSDNKKLSKPLKTNKIDQTDFLYYVISLSRGEHGDNLR